MLKDYATRAAQQLGSKLDGTVHCELLDYYACIMLQQHFAALHIAAPLPPPMLRADVVDIAKGYYVAALRHLRPEITIESVAAHASAVFSQLRAIAAERSPPLRRALEDGEAFDAAVHVWDVDATREDWVEKFTAAYKGAPPIITHPLQRHGGGAGGAGGARAPQQRRCAGQAVRAALHRRPRAVQQRLRRADLAGRGHAVLPRRQAHPGRGFNPPIHPDCVGVLELDGFSGREKHPGGAPLL